MKFEVIKNQEHLDKFAKDNPQASGFIQACTDGSFIIHEVKLDGKASSSSI